MATSSIIENIRVNNPHLLEEYVEAMEKGVKDPPLRNREDRHSFAITDPARIKAIAEKAFQRVEEST